MVEKTRYNEYGMPIIPTDKIIENGINKMLDGLTHEEKIKSIQAAIRDMRLARLGKVVRTLSSGDLTFEIMNGNEGYSIRHGSHILMVGHSNSILVTLPEGEAIKLIMDKYSMHLID
jgi:hypothetical protein